ncbi:PREDICTED: ligand-dependent nuclear receptor-interacting factor 1 isoform X1 [Ceratotherium simum simum]|uniref:Ligand-dependent nuclear receptor-interacting factor 1 isoform X1 n=3 Tax=Ceratotherium simum simum TaxID=73337 RepID=A0ABM1C7J7_CERSS|nr:PREDICTED: ligand-dependent nuclear receptor-interacting factor 1 isoform X1 [Ceratotherium simum simum]
MRWPLPPSKMSNNLQRVFLKPAEEKSGNASRCVSGCMYQVVQTIGSDGKNLLQLLPIPNSSGNLIPLVQSPVMSDALKGNTGNPVQVTFQTQISSSSTSTSVQLPIFQPASSSNCFLTRTVDTAEKVRVTSVGTENFTSSVSKVQSHGVKIDGLTMQTFAVSPSSTQNDSSYILVNTQSLPMTVKSPVLPSGHHLQIPAHAEVKSVPASSLPPSVQQKILATATTSTSGTVEASQIPSVIYVSPVNTVKNVVTKNFQNIYPKPVTEIAKPVILNTTQIPMNIAKETQLKGGQHSQAAPVKWIFQENLQPCTPSLVPVKSSNNVASKILKTFVDRKNLGDNTINMPPLSTVSPSGTQSKSMPIKDNALVMFNGKVYLLAKKGTDVLPSQIDQQNSVSPDIPPRKDTSQIVSSSPVTEISREVVNFVLAKSKSSQMETKSLSNTQLASMANLRAEKNKKVEKPSLSIPNPHNMNQSINYLKQSKTVFTKPDFPGGFSTGQNAPREGNIIQSIEKISSSVDATTVTSQQCVFRDQEPKIQCEMASTLEKITQERNDKKNSQGRSNKASYLKNDAEFKKIFGLTKDLRVCLTRIPDHLGSGEGFDSFSSLVKSDTYKKTEFIVKEEERKQGFDKKRKAKTVKKMDHTKKRKTESAYNTAVNGGINVISSQVVSSILPTSDVSRRNILTSCNKTREEKRTEMEHCTRENQEKGTLSSNAAFEQSHSFNKNYTEDVFPMTPPELEETIRDEKIRRLKQVLREKEAALEEMRKKMQQK